jgi:hypothetical protein
MQRNKPCHCARFENGVRGWMARKEHNLTGLEIEEDAVSYELKP